MNSRLLVSDVDHFRIDYEINPYMDRADQPDRAAAAAEHRAILDAHRRAGRDLAYLPSVPGCPDMVYTANAAVVRGDVAVLGNLPAQRRPETPHHRSWLIEAGFIVIDTPYAFSGQGDALPWGDLLLAGYGQRTDRRVHAVLREYLGYEIVPLRTVDPRWYDLDLAVAVIDENTLAYCPEALDLPSRARLQALGCDLVEVDEAEALGFALNLVSDGSTVTMSDGAPRFAAALRERGLVVDEVVTTQLRKGGGGVRCTSLTLDNPAAVRAVQAVAS
ncbi:MAG TPA: arginine deiminase-related protein [Pseudonocardia sp.]|uniref:dimethylarginine dimethylaminohydrolase family protein n=1 Tax=Pseudonocardia sp. TaxID=60912 RepID=UPI002B4ADC54|nr:arginine deiminase-related protein [Pseudonocardia sp.]HLU54236.1 arginine deiminase-related protein [Pseudonocardia sp.]